MTTIAPDPVEQPPIADQDVPLLDDGALDRSGFGGVDEEGAGDLRDEHPAEERHVNVTMVVAAGVLASLGAAWLATRVFRGALTPMAVASLGVAIGAGSIHLAHRLGRGGALQYSALPVALVAGAALATAGETGGRSLPAAVVDAFRGGGLLQPPIPFDAGWRFLVVVLFAFLSACATSAAVSLARPKLAVAVPMPVVVGAALIQPEGSELVASAVALVLVVAALALAYGADLASEGVRGSGFEIRRLGRGVGLLAFAVATLTLLAQTDFLFPKTDENEVIPPQRPPTPPPEPDRVIFRTDTDRPGPWRLGVLDVYDEGGLLLPPVDPARMRDVPASGRVSAPGGRATYSVTFEIADIRGQALPALPSPVSLTGLDRDLDYDPRTQTFKLVQTSVPRGLEYTVTAPVLTDIKLQDAPDPPPAIASEFLSIDPPPPGVAELLARAPDTNRFDRLQFVRQALYQEVVAAGAGKPVDVLPSKVDRMLAGGEATPYEINAAEVMLARWAGVPARLGFGYYGGEPVDGGLAFRPKHGAAWLEAYFEGAGWVPIVGTPPKAKPSISDKPKNEDPKVVPTDELALTVYVPVEVPTIRLVYEIVRYYVARLGPLLLAIALAVWAHPALLKRLRSGRRRKWAGTVGPDARVVVAYAELRDRLNDINIGDPRLTPLELLDVIEPDDEHAELGWLVTRVIWGDLGRDLRIDDVQAAEQLARSVDRRIMREQSALNRLLALTARTSLRDPWTDEIPNIWPRRERARAEQPARARRGLRRKVAASAAALAVLLGGCGTARGDAQAPSSYLERGVPSAVGPYDIIRNEQVEKEYDRPGSRALVTEGQVYTVDDGESIQGSIQFALFKDRVDTRSRKAQYGVLSGLGSIEAFRLHRFGLAQVWSLQTPEQQVWVWFPPERNAMELFVMRKNFEDAESVVRDVIAYQRHLAPTSEVKP